MHDAIKYLNHLKIQDSRLLFIVTRHIRQYNYLVLAPGPSNSKQVIVIYKHYIIESTEP